MGAGLLERLFQVLNDAEVVDEEAFREWAADKQDSFGKSQALAQLANWLNVLAEKVLAPPSLHFLSLSSSEAQLRSYPRPL